MISRYGRAVQVIVIIVVTLMMYSGCGNEGDTIYITSYEVPGIPANIQAVGGDGEVTIGWSPVEGATSYNIYWNTTGSVTTSDSAIISATSPYTHTGLTNDTTYYYIVTAINVEGEGEISGEASATPVDSTILNPPPAPTGVTATAADGQVTISWSPVEGATSYNIYWNTTGSVTTSDTAIISAPSPYVHMNLTNGTTYCYAVTAINNDGESDLSAEVSATPETTEFPPEAPTNVQAVGGDGQITISWSPVAGALTYNIYWGINQGVTTSDNVIIGASSPYVHIDLTNNTTYYYVVTAINVNGESSESEEVSAIPRTPFSLMLQKLTAADAQKNDLFGYSVSISGDYAIVGAVWADGPNNQLSLAGSAYIYHRTGPDSWDGGTKIVSPNANTGFGRSVSISSDYAIVSANNGAYIFRRIGIDTWDRGTKVGAAGGGVSIYGDYAIVTGEGGAYTYRRTGQNTWESGPVIVASDLQEGDNFGCSVSISGDYAVIGASREDGGAGDPLPDTGAAYIFRRTGPNTWDSGTKIVAPDAQEKDRFGYSVSISGDYAIVGAVWADGPNNQLSLAGSAYIFHRTGPNAWNAVTKIVAPDAQVQDRFGGSVSISGDYAIVGAELEDGGAGDPIPGAGAAYIFHRTGPNTWENGAKIVAQDAQQADHFGWPVSISGNNVIIGAIHEDGGDGDPLKWAGAAYIY